MRSYPEGEPAGDTAVGRGRRRRRQPHRGLRTAAIIAGVLVLVLAGLGGFVYARLTHNIIGVDIANALGNDRPSTATADSTGHTPLNILVLGSDSRAGVSGYGVNDHPPLSDTSLLVHISAARDRALVMSIPRDTLVDRPSCTRTPGGGKPGAGTDSGAAGAMFNTALAVGGPACAVKTVEKLTSVRIDHFVEIDFSGFKNMVNAVGGVNVCLLKAVDDPIHAHLVMPAGRHHLSGEQALAFVRERYGIGDGSDLGRIKMQQQFIGSLVTKVQSNGVLLNPARLYSLASAATKSVTTDSALASLGSLISLGEDLRRIPSAKIAFVTLPTVKAPSDPNRLVAQQPVASQLFTVIRTDRPTLTVAPAPAVEASRPAGPRPDQVQLTVLNGTTQPRAGATAAAALQALGFQVAEVGNALAHQHTTTLVEYSVGKEAAAQVVAEALPGSQLLRVTGRLRVTVVLGSDYRGVTPAPPSASASPSAAPAPIKVPVRKATQDVCSAS